MREIVAFLDEVRAPPKPSRAAAGGDGAAR